MTDLEKVKNWLLSYPAWDGDAMYVDYTDAAPGNTGIFPKGLEETRRRDTILGGRSLECRYRFALYKVAQSREAAAQWLLDFQSWVQAQSAAGLAPQFGDVAADEYIRAENGVLHKADPAGVVTYGVMITAGFTRRYDIE